jgi:hypothetical protein
VAKDAHAAECGRAARIEDVEWALILGVQRARAGHVTVAMEHKIAATAQVPEQCFREIELAHMRPADEGGKALGEPFFRLRQHVVVEQQGPQVLRRRPIESVADGLDHRLIDAAVADKEGPVLRSGRVGTHEVKSFADDNVHALAHDFAGDVIVPAIVIARNEGDAILFE